MNQKQRDMLCKMVEGRAAKIRAQLDTTNGLKCFGDLGPYQSILSHRFDDESIGQLPKRLRDRFNQLRQRRSKLDVEETALQHDIEHLAIDVAPLIREKSDAIKEAKARLTDEVQKAVLQIQFAENAEQAEAILNSLPSVESLL